MKNLYATLMTVGLLIPGILLADGTASVTVRPSHVDISSATSQGAVLVTLSDYSTDDVRYRLYSGSNQYNCWDAVSGTYISTNAYASGPLALGSASTGTTFWIPYERGSNASTSAIYRDRIGPEYTSNNNSVTLPAATEITASFSLSGSLVGSTVLPLTDKYVILCYNSGTLISASSSDLTTGAFTILCPESITVDMVEVRTLSNTIVASLTGSYTTTTSLGDIELVAAADVNPPVFTSGYPAVANIDATQADLEVSMNEAGKAYYVVVPDGAAAPTVEEVVAGYGNGYIMPVASGTIDVTTGGGTYSATITGLADKTNYDIYVVAEDDEDTPNRQTETVKVDLYTIRPPDVLLFADFETAGSLAPFTQVRDRKSVV